MQYDPKLVISTTWSETVKEQKLHYKNWLNPLTVTLPPPDHPGLLLLSLYTTIVNSRGVHCRLHAATGVLDMHNIGKDGFSVAPIANYRASVPASLEVSVREEKGPPDYVPPGPYKTPDLVALGTKIQADLSIFGDMQPADPFLLKCHVPVYRVANQVLPGAAYFSTHNTVDVSHQWFEHMSAQIAERHGTTTAEWTQSIETQFNHPPPDGSVSKDFHEAVGMALEIATAAVQSYEYVVDFFVNAKGAQQMYESFDNYFARRCGDCEDSAIAIKEILYNMEQLSSPTSTKFAKRGSHLYWLGKLAEMYVPCCVLGMVGHVSFTTTQTQNRQAHMYAKWIPRQEFYERLPDFKSPTKHARWESSLMSWVGEGTSTVKPFPTINWIKSNRPEKRDTETFERGMIDKPYTPIGNMSRVYDQMKAVKENTFYNLDIHAFTHKISDLRGRGSPVVFSFVDPENPKKWGVGFEDVLNRNYGLVAHTRYTKATLDEFDAQVRAAHPRISLTTFNPPQNTMANLAPAASRFAQDILKIGESVAHDVPIHTEYIVRGWNQMPEHDVNLLTDWLKQNHPNHIMYKEGWDNFSESRRIRVFKSNSYQTL